MWQITVAGEGTSGDDVDSPAERLVAWASMVARRCSDVMGLGRYFGGR